MNRSPTLEGFRAAFRMLSVTFAEIAWRWTFGGVASALFFFASIEFVATLPVDNADALLLRTKQPLLAGRALTHILRGNSTRAALAALFAAIALSMLWIVTASLGRAATVRALLDFFRTDSAFSVSSNPADPSRSFRSLIGLNSLRVAASLAMLFAVMGAAILSSFASPHANPQPALVFLIFMPIATFACIAWLALNWLLSLASIFTVRDGEDALGAVSAAISFFRMRWGSVAAVSIWTWLLHVAALSVWASVVSLLLAFVHVAPTRLMIAIVVLLTLAYFAIADWLYIVRLAGYIGIAEMPEAEVASASFPVPPLTPEPIVPSVQSTIDRDEPILSDLPMLYTGQLI